jgi:methionyl-tRNA synthetase
MKSVMDLAQFGNQYFDAVAPWTLIRSDKERCGTVLSVSLEICRALAVLGSPFMPFSSEKIWHDIGMEGSIEESGWNGTKAPLKEGNKMEKPVPLFAKVEVPLSGGFAKYSALDLRIGKVIVVEQHPNADKLYVMKVDIGRPITIVTGLKDFYSAEELSSKTLVIVSNLEPAKLRGVKSEGMLLAAEEAGGLALLTPESDLPPGTPVTSGLEVESKTISFKEFQELDIRVGSLSGGSPPKLDIGSRTVSCATESGEVGRKYAALVQEESAVVMHAKGDVKIVFDRDIPIGARVR